MKRIFVGIPLSIHKLPAPVRSLGKYPQLKLVEDRNLHITLVPPWKSSGWQLESEKLKKVEFGAFEVRFNKIEWGPNNREPRMVWLSGEATEQIYDLRFRIYEALGRQPEQRPFRLHVTLARLGNDFNILNSAKLPMAVDARQTVRKFVLYESRLLPGGAEYAILKEFDV